MQGQKLCWLSFVFIKDWRVVYSIAPNSGKAKSTTSIQTQGIVASEDAKISSPTKNVNVSAADRLTLRSFGGNIQADALNNITMSASQVADVSH